MKKMALYLPRAMQRALREAARREGKPRAVLIRRALEEYLRRYGAPALRSVGMGEDEGLAAQDAEDWLESEWAAKNP